MSQRRAARAAIIAPGANSVRLWGIVAVATITLSACATPAPQAPAQPSAYVTIDGDPPVIPWKETVADDGGVFREICLSRLLEVPAKLGWIWGDELLTQTPQRAYIWRRDFTTPRDTDLTRIHRVICSLLPSGAIDIQIATEQPVERLSVEALELVPPAQARAP